MVSGVVSVEFAMCSLSLVCQQNSVMSLYISYSRNLLLVGQKLFLRCLMSLLYVSVHEILLTLGLIICLFYLFLLWGLSTSLFSLAEEHSMCSSLWDMLVRLH